MGRLLKDFIQDRTSITHCFLPQAYLMGGMAAFLTRNKSLTFMSRRSLNFYQKKHPYLARMEAFLMKHTHHILGNSQAVVWQLEREEHVPPSKLQLIYNGIDLSWFGIKNCSALRKEYGFSETDFIFIIVANLIPYKGHADLLEALSLVHTSFSDNWKLLCIGRDEGIQCQLEKSAQRLGLHSQIQFLGSRKDIPNLLSLSDVGILCSHEEGFSNAVLEGMASHLPMIVTDVGGNAEAVLHGQTGLVVPARSPLELSKAILTLYKDSDCRRLMGYKGYQRVHNHFSLDQCVDQYVQLYLKSQKPYE